MDTSGADKKDSVADQPEDQMTEIPGEVNAVSTPKKNAGEMPEDGDISLKKNGDEAVVHAVITVSGKIFDNTTAVKSDASVQVKWVDAVGQEISGRELAASGQTPAVKIIVGEAVQDLSAGSFKYASAGSVGADTEVDVKLKDTENTFLYSGIDTDTYETEAPVVNQATIKKVEMQGSDVAEVDSTAGGFVNAGNNYYVKPDSNNNASVNLRSKTGYKIANKLNNPDNGNDNFTITSIACPVTDDGAVFYAMNGNDEIAKVTMDSVKIDNAGPAITAAASTIILGNENRSGHSFTITDAKAGVDKDSVYMLITDKNASEVSSNDSDWTAEGVSVNETVPGNTTAVTASVTIPLGTSGHVYLRAKDNLGNQTILQGYDAICENQKPRANLGVENANTPAKTKTVSFSGYESGSPVSGIREVKLPLKDSNGNPVTNGDIQLSVAENEDLEIDGWKVIWKNKTVTGIGDVDAVKLMSGNVTISGSSLNGTYSLEAAATDFCGNISEKSIISNLVFDSTAPAYSVVLDDSVGSAVDGTYYYNASSGKGLTVTISDTTLSGGSYAATLSDGNGNSVSGSEFSISGSSSDDGLQQGTITFAASEISELSEGTITLSVAAVDSAGNAAGKKAAAVKLGTQEEQTDTEVTFVLDKTAPRMTASKTTNDRRAPELNDSVFTYCDAFKTDINIVDDHINESYLKASFDQRPDDSSAWNIVNNGGKTVTFKGLAKGYFGHLNVSGKDYAGNLLIMADSFTAETSDGQDNWESTGTAGEFRTAYEREIENRTPVADVTYTGLGAEHIAGKNAYYNDSFEAVIELNNIDSEDYKLIQYKITKDSVDLADWKPITGNKTTVKVEKADDHTKDGNYKILLQGKNRAGTPLTVRETSPDGKTKEKDADTGGEEYTLVNTLILDTTNPEAAISITPGSGVAKPELNTEYGNRYYFNKDHTFTATIKETNYSKDLISVVYDSSAGSYNDVSEIGDFTDKNTAISEGESGKYTYSNTKEGIIRYRVSGTDLAGNPMVFTGSGDKYKDPAESGAGGVFCSCPIVTDKTAPVFALTYADSTEPVNKIFFRNDRKAVLSVDEKTIDHAKLLKEMDLTVKRDGSVISSSKNWKTEGTKSEYAMEFNKDGEYLLSINKETDNDKAQEIRITDLAGNEGKLQLTGKAPLHFVVGREYTITFVNEDGTELQSGKVVYGETPTYSGETPTKAADDEYSYTFKEWQPQIAEVTQDAVYTAVYEKTPVSVKTGILTFDPNGGNYSSAPDGYTLNDKTGKITIEVNAGEVITIPAAPVRDGYTFQYWKGSKYLPGDKYTVKGDHSFTAVWKKNEAKTYTVSFHVNGHGTAPASQKVEEGKKASKPKNPTASGYTFGGWFTEKACKNAYDFSTPVTKDITLYAKWTKKDGSSGKNGRSSSASSGTSAAKTGDDSQLGLWFLLMALSLTGLVMILRRKRNSTT